MQKRCPKCQTTLAAEAEFCPQCGSPAAKSVAMPTQKPVYQPDKKPWHERWWGIILLVFLAGPLGVVLFWLVWRSKLAKPFKWALSVIVFLVVWYLQILLFT